MSPRNLLTIAAVLLVAIVVYGMCGRIEQSREVDPSGKYHAVWSHRPYQYLPFMGLGTDSDSRCYVEIVDHAGRSFGEIPVEMLQNAGVEWTGSGAEIKLVGAWNFSAGTCFYWSEDQNTRIRVRSSSEGP